MTIIKKCPQCGERIYLYGEHMESDKIIVHCLKPNCKWQSMPVYRHLTGEIQNIKHIKDTWR